MPANLWMTKKIPRIAKTLWNDTNGIILPYVTLMLIVIVGMAVLAIDGARFMSLQTQLQNGADALALAGAAELDRARAAGVRGVNAIRRVLRISNLFGAGPAKNVQVTGVQFFGQLPETDDAP